MPSLVAHLTPHLAALSQPVHPTFFPYSILLPLHAVRCALAWRSAVGASRAGELEWGQRADLEGRGGLRGLFGFGVVAFGGSTMASVLLGLPPSWLTTPHLLPLYSAIYILICLLPISFLLALLPTPVLPLLFSTLDAVNRSLSIASTLALLASHPDPFLRSSPSSLSSLLPTLLLPALAVSGGGLVTSFLSLSSDRWALAPPPFLRPGNSLRTTLLSSLDLWSGAVAAAMYDFLVDGPGTKALRVQSAGAVTAFGTRSGSLLKDEEKFHPGAWSALEARAACVLLLAVLLGGRAIALWLGEEQQPAATIANGKVLEKERGIEPMDEKTRQGGSSTGSSVSATASSPAARLRRTKEFQ